MKNKNIINSKEMRDSSISGVAFISEDIRLISFAPDDPVPGRVKGFRRRGTAQQMTDGTFDFVASPQQKVQSTLIRKLAHGRASLTKDNAIQLTLKVFKDEGVNIGSIMMEEAETAVSAIREFQLSH